MKIVLLTGDLMVVSRVGGAAMGPGVEMVTASSTQQAAELCDDAGARLLVVDLSMPMLDVSALVRQVKSNGSGGPTIVAFGPHVHEDRLAAARAAGCDQVVSRGQFLGQLGSLLQL
jgi:CheY-like chemotaxis protein